MVSGIIRSVVRYCVREIAISNSFQRWVCVLTNAVLSGSPSADLGKTPSGCHLGWMTFSAGISVKLTTAIVAKRIPRLAVKRGNAT